MIQLVSLTPQECSIALDNLQDCRAFGQLLAQTIRNTLPCTIGLVGTLGAGKTQLVKFIAQSLGANPEDVMSPTFVLIHPLGTNPEIHHIDAYRIRDSDEFLELGIEELFEQPVLPSSNGPTASSNACLGTPSGSNCLPKILCPSNVRPGSQI